MIYLLTRGEYSDYGVYAIVEADQPPPWEALYRELDTLRTEAYRTYHEERDIFWTGSADPRCISRASKKGGIGCITVGCPKHTKAAYENLPDLRSINVEDFLRGKGLKVISFEELSL